MTKEELKLVAWASKNLPEKACDVGCHWFCPWCNGGGGELVSDLVVHRADCNWVALKSLVKSGQRH